MVRTAATRTLNILSNLMMRCISYCFPLTYINITAAGSRKATVTRLRKRIAGQLSAAYCGRKSGKGKGKGTHTR